MTDGLRWNQNLSEEEHILRASSDDGFHALQHRVRWMRNLAWVWTGMAILGALVWIWLGSVLMRGGLRDFSFSPILIVLMIPLMQWNAYGLMRQRLAAANVVRRVRMELSPAPGIIITRPGSP